MWARLVKANGTLAVQVECRRGRTAPSFSPRPPPFSYVWPCRQGQGGDRHHARPRSARSASSPACFDGLPGSVARRRRQPFLGKMGLVAAATAGACRRPFRPRRPVPGAPPRWSLDAPFPTVPAAAGRLDGRYWSFLCQLPLPRPRVQLCGTPLAPPRPRSVEAVEPFLRTIDQRASSEFCG